MKNFRERALQNKEVKAEYDALEQMRNTEIEATRAALIEAEAKGTSPLSAEEIREDVLKHLRENGEI